MPLAVRPLDTLNRRIRFAGAQPRGKRIVLGEDDLIVFDAIHRHGSLPSHYLRAFTPRTNENAFADRLTRLYHGAELNGPYLTKPEKQFNSFFADIQHLVYDLNRHSKELIVKRGKWSPFSRRDNHFVHQLMNACVGASIELGCKDIRYIPRHEVLSKKGNPMELPLSQFSEQHRLVPDDLFGLDYDGSYRFFAVEVDRNTESIERADTGEKQPPTIVRKLANYIQVMNDRTYREVWGSPNLMVLIVTTNETHMKKMMARLLALDSRLSERFVFKTYAEFGPMWRVPKTILADILEPWQRADGSTFDITKSGP